VCITTLTPLSSGDKREALSVQLRRVNTVRVLPCPEHFAICVFWGGDQRLTIVSITVMELFNYMKWELRVQSRQEELPRQRPRNIRQSEGVSMNHLEQSSVPSGVTHCHNQMSLYIASASRCGDKRVLQIDNSLMRDE
jgi:hypothetical protein